jgi:HEAT repeat protein
MLSLRFHCGLAVVALLCMTNAGCVDGPFGGFAAINPYIQRQWAEDEKFGPTFHRRFADLRGLKSSARRLEAQKREEIAADMTRLITTETNPVLRAEMVGIMGELGTVSTIPGLQTATSDPDKDVRIAACRAWSSLGPQNALPALTEVLDRETDVDVRLAALGELGQFQDPAAIAVLGKALDDHDPAIQQLAVESLKTATGRDYGNNVPAWRDFVQGQEPQLPKAPSLVKRLKNWF